MSAHGPETDSPIVGRPRIAPAGLILLWLSSAALLAGLWRTEGALLWLGLVGFSLLILARWLAPQNLRHLRVSRECPSRVFAGEPLDWTLRVEQAATGAFSTILPGGAAVEIRDSLLPRRAPGLKPGPLWPGDRAEVTLRTRLFRRGRDSRAEYEAVSLFPFGLFETHAVGTIADRLPMAPGGGVLVYPPPVVPDALRRELEWARFELAFPHGFEPEIGGEFRGVRAYRSGDAVKSVHWSATARVGEIMVREWDPPAPRPMRFGLLLHTLEPAGAARLLRPDRWERCLKLVSGIVVFCRDAGIPLTFVQTAGCSDTVAIESMRLPEQRGYGAALEWAALAIRSGASQESVVAAALADLCQSCDRVFVVSDVPLAQWRKLPAIAHTPGSLTCLDADSGIATTQRTAPKKGRKAAISR